MLLFCRRRRDKAYISIKIKYLAIHTLVSELNLQDYKTLRLYNGFKCINVKSDSFDTIFQLAKPLMELPVDLVDSQACIEF